LNGQARDAHDEAVKKKSKGGASGSGEISGDCGAQADGSLP